MTALRRGLAAMVDSKASPETGQRRLEALFDAIIAIAMTMMALEIAVPDAEQLELATLTALMSDVTVYLISYVVLASIWMIHALLYSAYSSSGLHDIGSNIALMFVVTLFPIITKSMSIHKGSALLGGIYIGTYLLMEAMLLSMLLRARRRNAGAMKAQMQTIKTMIEISPDAHGQDPEKAREVANRLELAERYMNDKEVSRGLFQEMIDALPAPIQDLLHTKEQQKELDFRLSISSLLIGFVTVSASVTALLVNPYLCYLALVTGIAALMVTNSIIRNHLKRQDRYET